jgi:hypothetical protein
MDFQLVVPGGCWFATAQFGLFLVSFLHSVFVLVFCFYIFLLSFLGRVRDYSIGSNFWKLYLIRTGFTLGELVSLVKVFRLFRLERIFLMFRVWTQ